MAWQLLVNSVVAAGVYALVGVGFALIYRVYGFFHFSYGAIIVVGAYGTYLFKTTVGLPVWAALLAGTLVASGVGCLFDLGIYCPLRRRNATPSVLLLSSLGLYVLVQNAISLAFGSDTKRLRGETVTEGFNVWGAYVTGVQLTVVVASAVLVIALAVFLKCTRVGTAIRCVANDSLLAAVSGIRSERMLLLASALGSLLAGMAGVFIALDVDITPSMGLTPLMMGVVAVVIGGKESIAGVALGAILLGMAQQFGVWGIGSQWQDAIAFLALLAFLLFRPQGFLGRTMGKATV